MIIIMKIIIIIIIMIIIQQYPNHLVIMIYPNHYFCINFFCAVKKSQRMMNDNLLWFNMEKEVFVLVYLKA